MCAALSNWVLKALCGCWRQPNGNCKRNSEGVKSICIPVTEQIMSWTYFQYIWSKGNAHHIYNMSTVAKMAPSTDIRTIWEAFIQNCRGFIPSQLNLKSMFLDISVSRAGISSGMNCFPLLPWQGHSKFPIPLHTSLILICLNPLE